MTFRSWLSPAVQLHGVLGLGSSIPLLRAAAPRVAMGKYR